MGLKKNLTEREGWVKWREEKRGDSYRNQREKLFERGEEKRREEKRHS